MKKPLVSILMNCFNGERYLKESIDSALKQTYKNWELVFWDNQSSDKSAKIFKSYSDSRLKYYLAPNHSKLGEARKRAFKYLKGEFVAVLDVDDIWYSHKLERQIQYFSDSETGIVICNAYFFNEYKKKTIYQKPPFEGWVFDKLIENYYVCLVTLVFRKSIIKKMTNQFDPDFDFIADFDLVLRASKVSKLKFHNEVLAGWRVHGNNDTFKSPYNFVEETTRWISKQLAKKILDKKIHKSSIDKLINTNNRQIAIFELINGRRMKCIKKIIKQKNKGIRDYIILIAAILFINKKMIKTFYLKRISLGLLT